MGHGGWAGTGAGRFSLRRTARVVAGAVLLTASGYLSIPMPGTPVPQSAQTLAVLLLGIVLGGRDGGLAVLMFLLVGALGLPVFAEGAAGWSHLTGQTAGYLVGFVVAAVAVGLLLERGFGRRAGTGMVVMVGGHVVILGLGWLRLSLPLGMTDAFQTGVLPFIVGAVVKSALATEVMMAVRGRGMGVRREP